ncbi:hypothetical protein VSDG_05380 [Cytospora chrysosperma]|uniref:Kinetochore protein mis14 n=1 Tax=Cytospora chrysosperma TaxID=252740 RepID=A0A423VWS5_CYTCH|nr:hypothetical protein VSDG_05380 [Valsa sordida]
MDGAHRKIELQSPEDLTFLINNVRRAATEHVTAAFPPVEGQDDAEEDELRVRIEKLVDDVRAYISQTFTLAAPNLSINGFDLDPATFPAAYLDASSPASTAGAGPNARKRRQKKKKKQKKQQHGDDNDEDEDEDEDEDDDEPVPAAVIQYEPFDGRKRLRVEELAREEEDLMREVAALKRRVPAAAAAAYADGFREGVRADEEALARARAVATSLVGGDGDGNGDGDGDNNTDTNGAEGEGPGAGDGGADGAGGGRGGRKRRKKTTLLDGTGPLERQADVERGYGGLVETLSRLKRDMPATVAKMERARVAGEYVVTER